MEAKKLLPVNLESYKPLRELVLEAIREAIISGILKPRERLMEIQLAEELGVSLSAITALVNRLVNNGLAVRTRDLTDRRLVWLEATEQGADVMRRCLEGRRKVAEKYFGQIPEEDMEKLIEIYEKVLTILRSEKTENAARNRNHPQ